jgi:hypothetical protein
MRSCRNIHVVVDEQCIAIGFRSGSAPIRALYCRRMVFNDYADAAVLFAVCGDDAGYRIVSAACAERADNLDGTFRESTTTDWRFRKRKPAYWELAVSLETAQLRLGRKMTRSTAAR